MPCFDGCANLMVKAVLTLLCLMLLRRQAALKPCASQSGIHPALMGGSAQLGVGTCANLLIYTSQSLAATTKSNQVRQKH